MPPQDAPKTAVSGLLIGVVQLLIGAPMHTRRLFRKRVENVRFGSQALSDLLCFYKSAHTDGFLLTFISQLVAMAAGKIVPQAV
jgi:hypothetical protein